MKHTASSATYRRPELASSTLISSWFNTRLVFFGKSSRCCHWLGSDAEPEAGSSGYGREILGQPLRLWAGARAAAARLQGQPGIIQPQDTQNFVTRWEEEGHVRTGHVLEPSGFVLLLFLASDRPESGFPRRCFVIKLLAP